MSRDLIRQLRDRVEELEDLLGVSDDASRPYRVFGLSATPRRVLGFIVSREIASREGLHAALQGNLPECRQSEIRVLDAHIWRIRKALKPHGITIRTEWGIGYSMSKADKAKLEALLEGL